MKARMKCCLIMGWCLSLSCLATVRVAFLELRKADGQVLQLEPDFRYAHVAIAMGDRWLHAHPVRGVEVLSRVALSKVGKIQKVLSSEEEEGPSTTEVDYFLGKAFDSVFSWSDEKIYCAELVAKLLGISPSPMHFDLKFWDKWFQRYEGKPGSSPYKVYRELLGRDYSERNSSEGASTLFAETTASFAAAESDFLFSNSSSGVAPSALEMMVSTSTLSRATHE